MSATGLVIAVDGTSGSGKSSTCRGVAERLGLRYLDTGAQYRALTWWLLEQGVDTDDPGAVAAMAMRPEVVSGTDPSAPTVAVDGREVSGEIRTDAVNHAVSPVSAVPAVRERLVALQRATIGRGGIVVEGRDIASVVWPEAQVKVFLTADAGARAARRAAEEGSSDVATTQESLLYRDQIDSGRDVAPLVHSDGAIEVDSTHRSLEEVIDLVVGLAGDVTGDAAGSGPDTGVAPRPER